MDTHEFSGERRPYPKQIGGDRALICEMGAKHYPGWPRTHLLCYQSAWAPRSGSSPRLRGRSSGWGHEGVKEMARVPISFVTEHIETLHEINIGGREERKKLGIESFRMMPRWATLRYSFAALKDLVLRAVGIRCRYAI